MILIPQSTDEHVAWITFGESMCENESFHDMDLLDRFGSRLEHDLSTAVIKVPEKIPEYVSFAFEALTNPRSDYAVEMQGVCKARHLEFIRAISALSPDDRTRFDHYILDPNTCKALRLPEAE